MKTQNKIVSLDLSVNQYEHLNELARLIETVTDVPTDADTVANKLFERALAGLSIGKPVMAKPASEETESALNPSEEEKTSVGVGQEYEEDTVTSNIRTEKEEKASPQSISSVVTSLQANAIQREQISSSKTFNLTGAWGKLLGQVNAGCTIAIVAYERHQATKAALSLCHELNRELNVLYIAPSIVGDYHELATHFGIASEPRPKHTKIIHYCPQNSAEWKRTMLNEQGNTKYQVIVVDAAHEADMNPESGMRIPFIENTPATHDVVTVSIVSIFDDIDPEESVQHSDVVLRVEPDNAVLVQRNNSSGK